jgi:hypothetical protein
MDAAYNVPGRILFKAQHCKNISVLVFIARLSHRDTFLVLLKPVFAVLRYTRFIKFITEVFCLKKFYVTSTVLISCNVHILFHI